MLTAKNTPFHFSPASEGWLTSCLDPFHDFQYDVRGLPDERSAPSVVQIHTQSFSLSAPVSAGEGNWDATVIYTGFNSPIDVPVGCGMVAVSNSATHNYHSEALSPGRPSGALDIWAGGAGRVFAVGQGDPTDMNACLGSIKSVDRCRLIGVAFEVHNTTATLNKQGSLTVAQLPDSADDSSVVTYADFNANVPPSPVQGKACPCVLNPNKGKSGFEQVSHPVGAVDILPNLTVECQADRGTVFASTVAPLLTVPGSQTWAAEEGVYAVPRMTRVPREVVLYQSADSGVQSRVPVLYDTRGGVATPEPLDQIDDFGTRVPGFVSRAPSGFSPMQVWFAGLSPSTSLTITFRTIVEYFPVLGSSLLPMAEPSPVLDLAVLGCYSAVITEAPYAVPVGQNAAGDYLRKIGRVLAQALQITSPMFGAFAPLVAGVAGMFKSGLKEPKPKEPKRATLSLVRKDEAGPRSRQVRVRGVTSVSGKGSGRL